MCFLGRHISIKPPPRHFYIHLQGVFFHLQITCRHLFCCLQFLILLFPKQLLCWLPKPRSTVTEREAVSLVLLFWTAQHSLSCHFATLCRGLLLKSLHRHISRSKAHVLQSCPAFFHPGLYNVIGKWLNTWMLNAYHIVAIPQFNSLLIPVLSPHFLSNELKLLLKISTSFSLVTALTTSRLISEGFSFAESCRIFHLPWFWPITLLLHKTALIHKSRTQQCWQSISAVTDHIDVHQSSL